MTPEDADDQVVLVRVAHDPGFRAVVVHGPVEDPRREQLVFSSAETVLGFLRDWLRAQERPEQSGRAL